MLQVRIIRPRSQIILLQIQSVVVVPQGCVGAFATQTFSLSYYMTV